MTDINEIFGFTGLIEQVKLDLVQQDGKPNQQHVKLDAYISRLEEKGNQYRTVYKAMVLNELNGLDRELTEDELDEQVDNYISQQTQKAISAFKEQLEQDEQIKLIHGFITSKENYQAIIKFITVLMGLLLGVYLFFQPNDISMWLGLGFFLSSLVVAIKFNK